jgi:cytoskeletal protein CcmA (bactofilin family)
MAVFRSKAKPETSQAIHTLIGKDVLIKGELHTGDHSIRLEGTIEGTVHSTGEVTVAPSGLIEGTIHAKHLIVTGKAKGVMKIAECLEIHGTGFVEGEVEVGSLVVDEGGTLQGTCIRRDLNKTVALPAKNETKVEDKQDNKNKDVKLKPADVRA